MRRPSLVVLVLAALLAATPAAARAGAAPLTELRTAGTAWGHDPATGRLTVTVDDTVRGSELAALRRAATRSGAVLRHEPGRLRTLIAGGQAIYGGGGRCSLGVNARSGSTWYFVTAGHCTNLGATWYADSARTSVLGSRTGSSFPGNDYGLVRYTGTVAHPSAVYTYPGQVTISGAGSAYVGQAVCRSGATTGVRCGVVTGLNQTVNYAEGRVTGLIRTNICAEPGDSGGPLYVAATGTVLGILSGGSGTCASGGTSYYQPILQILAAYGLSIP
ncbi:S1 family peptidase [Micromonospora sp. WMMD975]|uniref:S1 family peptidase n=1 Tax=Micromonospora sp. WMMD975 TaxID=3016087 RepID=UPI00249BDFB2|nr:S1 family peptidase [Micromonospora sp. WMMD975]WFE35811.1 S1 family peptidase [Micromonospora sp. WMMD975]